MTGHKKGGGGGGEMLQWVMCPRVPPYGGGTHGTHGTQAKERAMKDANYGTCGVKTGIHWYLQRGEPRLLCRRCCPTRRR